MGNKDFGYRMFKASVSQLRQRWDDSIQMLHVKMLYEDMSGLN